MNISSAFHSKNAIVTGIYGSGMKAYDSNANASVEGGRRKERDGEERKREGKALGSGRGQWCEREEGRSHGRWGAFESAWRCRSPQYAAQRAGSRTRIVSLCSRLSCSPLFPRFPSLSLSRCLLHAARLEYASTNISRIAVFAFTCGRSVKFFLPLCWSRAAGKSDKIQVPSHLVYTSCVTFAVHTRPYAGGSNLIENLLSTRVRACTSPYVVTQWHGA